MLILFLLISLMFLTPVWAVYVLFTVFWYIKRDRSDELQCAERKKAMKISIIVFISMLVILGLIFLIWGGDLAEI